MGAIQYLGERGGAACYPGSMQDLWKKSLVGAENFLCLSDKSPAETPEGVKHSYCSAFDLALAQSRHIPDEFPARMMMAWERAPFHHRDQRNVAFFDGHVERVSQAAFRELRSQLERAIDELQQESPELGGPEELFHFSHRPDNRGLVIRLRENPKVKRLIEEAQALKAHIRQLSEETLDARYPFHERFPSEGYVMSCTEPSSFEPSSRRNGDPPYPKKLKAWYAVGDRVLLYVFYGLSGVRPKFVGIYFRTDPSFPRLESEDDLDGRLAWERERFEELRKAISPHNMHASCANCRKFMWYAVYSHAQEHDDWLPSGGKTPYESLSAAIKDEAYVRHFASHAMQAKLMDYWKKHEKLAPEFCCYEYVEGLRLTAPSNLVLFYTKEPSLWECWKHKRTVLGRAVGDLGNSWTFLPEEEFQRFLQHTREYLRANGRLQ